MLKRAIIIDGEDKLVWRIIVKKYGQNYLVEQIVYKRKIEW